MCSCFDVVLLSFLATLVVLFRSLFVCSYNFYSTIEGWSLVGLVGFFWSLGWCLLGFLVILFFSLSLFFYML